MLVWVKYALRWVKWVEHVLGWVKWVVHVLGWVKWVVHVLGWVKWVRHTGMGQVGKTCWDGSGRSNMCRYGSSG